MNLYESFKKNLNEADTVKVEDIINPEDKDYADGHLMRVLIWSGAGYHLAEFWVYVKGDDAEAALEQAVAWCDNHEDGKDLIFTINEVEDMAEQDYAEELANYDGDLDEFITNYLNYVYVDATEYGASQPYYVLGENLRIEDEERPVSYGEEVNESELKESVGGITVRDIAGLITDPKCYFEVLSADGGGSFGFHNSINTVNQELQDRPVQSLNCQYVDGKRLIIIKI